MQNRSSFPILRILMTVISERTKMVAFGQQIGSWKTSPPRNSLAIVELALLKRFDVIELDVRVSSDGVAVLAHDDILKGPKGEIKVSEASISDLLKFQIGDYEGVPQYVVSLSSALIKAGEKEILLDPRAKPEEYSAIRSAVENVGFDPSKLLFCVYGRWQAKVVKKVFPESIYLYKLACHYADVTLDQLDEVADLGMHGAMLFRPIYDEDFAEFMVELKKRNLQVLFYVHGGWPEPHKPDLPDESLTNMIDIGVEYVTTIACDIPTFRSLVGLES